jgi:hypothetical protein
MLAGASDNVIVKETTTRHGTGVAGGYFAANLRKRSGDRRIIVRLSRVVTPA